jgi:Phage derived protein Gp49-like (DUF891)
MIFCSNSFQPGACCSIVRNESPLIFEKAFDWISLTTFRPWLRLLSPRRTTSEELQSVGYASAPVRKVLFKQLRRNIYIIYLTTIGDVVHLLHAFQKKTQATAKRDIDLAKARLRQIR